MTDPQNSSSFSQDLNAPIFVAGHRGLVGSALVRALQRMGYKNLLLRTRQELDLSDESLVFSFFEQHRPAYVFMAAAKVGGIKANQEAKYSFLMDNLVLQNNVIRASLRWPVKKFLFLGSSCIYPKMAPQPLREESLLTSALEETNEGYALAKIAGLKACQYLNRDEGKPFISAMPTNLYGPGDLFDLNKSHVIPALLRKFHEAKVQGTPSVEIWGSGRPLREFLHADDAAAGLIHLMNNYHHHDPINLGTGVDLSIADLAALIGRVVGYQGTLSWNTTMPDGTPRKLLDISRLQATGWVPSISLEAGLRQTYQWALEQGVFGTESRLRG